MWLGARDPFLSFRGACISNLSLLLSLEPFEKFVVGEWVVGGWWVGRGWWSKVILVLSLRLKLNNIIFEKLGGFQKPFILSK